MMFRILVKGIYSAANKKVVLILLMALSLNQILAQAIFSNPITGTNPNTSNPYTVGQTVASGLTVSGIGRGTGITGRNSNNSYNARGWTTNITPDLNDYFEWTITPNTCYKTDFQNLSVQVQAGGVNGATRIQLRSNIDNFASVIKIDTITSTAAANFQYNLSSFTNITSSISFRLYAYRSSNENTEFALNSFTFNGSNSLFTVVANAGPDQTICIGNTAVLSAAGGNSYTWSSGQNTSSASVTPSSTTTYTVTAAVGTCTATDQVTVNTITPSIPYSLGTNTYYIWRGATSTDYNSSSNWYKYDGSVYTIPNDYPNVIRNVIIPSGLCVNNPLVINSISQSDSLIILSGATVSFAGQGHILAHNDVQLMAGATIDMGQSSAVLEVKDGNLKMFGNAEFIPGNGTVKFHNSINHPEAHTLICESSSNNTFFNLDFHGDNDPSINDFILGSNINVTGQLKVSTNNFKLNGFHLDLGSTGTISEGNNNKKIYDVGNGYISSERLILADGNTYNLGNLGLTIKAATGRPLGLTLVKRYHSSISYDLDGLFNSAVSRYYSVTPQYNGGTTYTDGLGATVTFNYATVSLSTDDMANEMNFTMYRKGQGESSWQKLEGGVLNMNTKTYTYSNFPKFSDVTLGGSGSALPVDLLSFSGKCSAGSITLEWETASEHNSAYFDVEKSRDGETWQLLTTVQAAGNSNQKLSYSTMDLNALEDHNYYRLKQVDIDGTEKYYDIINVVCNESKKSFISTYPNPSGNSFQLVVNDNDLVGPAILTISDSKGNSIFQRELNMKEGINMFMINEQLASGIYFVYISNGKLTTKPIRHFVK
jgi:hypothetical protein